MLLSREEGEYGGRLFFLKIFELFLFDSGEKNIKRMIIWFVLLLGAV